MIQPILNNLLAAMATHRIVQLLFTALVPLPPSLRHRRRLRLILQPMRLLSPRSYRGQCNGGATMLVSQWSVTKSTITPHTSSDGAPVAMDDRHMWVHNARVHLDTCLQALGANVGFAVPPSTGETGPAYTPSQRLLHGPLRSIPSRLSSARRIATRTCNASSLGRATPRPMR